MRRLLMLVLAGAAVVACSSGTTGVAQLASSPGSIGVGEQRILVGVIDLESGSAAATPDVTPVATLRDDIGSPLGEYEGRFVPVIPGVRGVYAFDVEIPGPATYQLTIEAGELGSLGPLGLVAVEDPPQVEVGEPAPESETRTLTDTPLQELTSDPTPDESLYQMTVADAVRSGPAVIVFATPAWCTSEACGPMVDQVGEIAPEFPAIDFVHVEVYENIQVTEVSELIQVPAVEEWGIRSEPWLYVVDETGTVTAAFEGAVSDAELQAALGAVAG